MRRLLDIRRTALAGAATLAALALSAVPAYAVVPGYDMDETSGSTMVGSGGAPDGKISGDVNLGVSGVAGTAYAFNEDVGSCDSSWRVTGSGAVTIPASSAFTVGTQPFSFSLWLNTTAVPGADSGASADCDFDVWRRSGNWKLEVIPQGTTPNRYGVPKCVWKGVVNGTKVGVALKSKAAVVTDGNWHQVTCSRTAAGEQLIVDGSVRASSPTNVGSITTNATIYVGTQEAGVDYYEGRLDDLTFSVG
jgi:hypothetical protein